MLSLCGCCTDNALHNAIDEFSFAYSGTNSTKLFLRETSKHYACEKKSPLTRFASEHSLGSFLYICLMLQVTHEDSQLYDSLSSSVSSDRLRIIDVIWDALKCEEIYRNAYQMRAHAKTPLERMDLGLLFFSSTADEQGTRELQKLKEKIKHQDS